MDNDTLSDAQVKDVQTWCIDWFFYAFGTFGITYNFQSWISDLEYEREREEELAYLKARNHYLETIHEAKKKFLSEYAEKLSMSALKKAKTNSR